jgi:hypothetical protein
MVTLENITIYDLSLHFCFVLMVILRFMRKINDNVYKLELPPEFGVSPTFNIYDLRPYLGEEDEVLSRMMSIQEGEDDEDISTLDTTMPSIEVQGPITRS